MALNSIDLGTFRESLHSFLDMTLTCLAIECDHCPHCGLVKPPQFGWAPCPCCEPHDEGGGRLIVLYSMPQDRGKRRLKTVSSMDRILLFKCLKGDDHGVYTSFRRCSPLRF